MKKIFWKSLNPTDRLKRFIHMSWLLLLAILVMFLNLDFMVALLITGIMLTYSYMEYKKLKKNSIEFKENKQKG